MPPILTEKKKRFAEEYLKCLNATEAAKRAGYSASSAYSTGHRLLKDDEVKKYIQGVGNQVQKDNILSINDTLAIISSMAKGERSEEKEVITKRPKFINHPTTNKPILVYEEELEVIELKAKNSDVLKGAELLGKYHALFTDNQNISAQGPIFIIDDIPDQDLSDYKPSKATDYMD